MTETTLETLGFQTEAKKLLKLMINSLYSNREIFLRELISNASDAIDRLRFEALNDESLIADDPDFRIVVAFDKDAGTVSIVDNGIGMSREEAVQHLGTIAKSGTEEFFDRLTGDQRKDSALIGQFGVGFYSSFIVAKEVEVLTRRAGDDAGTRWTSTGEDEFAVEDVADLPRGTRVTLHLKTDAVEFADGFRLRSIVRRYSDHVGVPVMMAKEGEAVDEEGGAGDENNAGEGKEGTRKEAPELEAVNSAKALWTRQRTDIGEDEYKEFYKHLSHDFDDPAGVEPQSGRGQAGIHQPALCAEARPVRSMEPRTAAWLEAVRAARLHHGRSGSVPAVLSALRARHSRFQRLAAERVARNSARGCFRPHHQERADQARAGHAGEDGCRRLRHGLG